MEINNNIINVCLNYYGQPRNTDITSNIYYNFIHIDHNKYKLPFNVKYHIIYTTWKSEDISNFKQLFPSSYIEQIDEPNMENYRYLIEKFKIDISNPNKTIDHYIKGFYVKQASFKTIEKYENDNNIKFDFIITIRTDIYINYYLPSYYEVINNNLDNTVYTANEPKFAIYNSPALPDVICISNKKTMEKILNQLSILEHCTVNGSDYFHPETSFYNALKYYNLHINELNFKAFPEPI